MRITYLRCVLTVLSVYSLGGCSSGDSAGQRPSAVQSEPERMPSAPLADFDQTGIRRLGVLTIDRTHSLRSDSAELTDVDDTFTRRLQSGGWEVIDRANLASAMKEAGLQNSGVTNDADSAIIGRIANVPALLIVNILELKATQQDPPPSLLNSFITVNGRRSTPPKIWMGRARLSLRLIKVETNAVLTTGSVEKTLQITARDDTMRVLEAAAQELASGFPKAKS